MICACVFSSCQQTRYWDSSAYMEGDRSHPIISIYNQYEERISPKSVIFVSGGVTEFENTRKIDTIHQTLMSRKQLNLEESRKLFVYLVETLVDEVRMNEDVKSFLPNSSFSASRVQLTLLLTDKKGSYLPDHLYISRISLDDGLIRFFAHGKEPKVQIYRKKFQIKDEPDYIVEVHQESLKEARKKIAS